MHKARRNDPCPCRSGKKYKHCCLSCSEGGGDVDLQAALQNAFAFCEAGHLHQADLMCQQIVQSEPDQPDAWYLMGVMACNRGDTAKALDCLARAILWRPQFAEAHYHLGLVHTQLHQLEQAEYFYRQAIAAAPAFVQAYGNLGLVLNRQGRSREALSNYMTAMSLHESVEVKIGAAECLQRMSLDSSHGYLRGVLTRAITEAWRRPEELAPAAAALLTCDARIWPTVAPANPVGLQSLVVSDRASLVAAGDDELLLGLLQSATVRDATLERWLTSARAALLDVALEPDRRGDSVIAVHAAITQQCFINGYAWIQSPHEVEQVARLQAKVNDALRTGGAVSANGVLGLASYRSLLNLENVDALLARAWPGAVRAVLQQQVEEPRLEARLRADVPVLTPVGAGVSCDVRQQYEEHPYPRWARSSLFSSPVSIDDRIRAQLPHARFKPLGPRTTLDILVAGCGTGRHAIETACHYRGARVLAIDLSANSLGYAVRKSKELGLNNVEYAQADILHLASLERRFDVIECVGVLHHTSDPEEGWQALLSVLRPGGLMLIGLYSEMARFPVVEAHRFIAERGLASTADGIRDFRAVVLGNDCPHALKPLTTFGDFFGLNACRDLLFHVQEHRTTLREIQAQLDTLGLDFVGLNVEPSVLRSFRARFPGEEAVLDLDLWHRYESENPATFVGMYQFWVQKPSCLPFTTRE